MSNPEREKAIEDICQRTGKTREQAIAFLDVLGSGLTKRGLANAKVLTEDETAKRVETFLGPRIPDDKTETVTTAADKMPTTGPCTCANDRSAWRCPQHTQADYDAADAVRTAQDVKAVILDEPCFSDWTERYWRDYESMKPMLHITIEDYRDRILARLEAVNDD